MSKIPWKLTIVSVVIAFVVRNLLDSVRPFKAPLPTNDASHCKLHEGPTGAEDFVLTKHGGWIITSSLDCGHLVDNGVDVCMRDTGGLWVFHSDANMKPSRIEIEGLPKDVASCFMTHGLFLSNTTDRLYAVTHHGNYSSIEIFAVGYSAEEEDKPPTLKWIRSVTSDSFLNLGPNDVVEGASAGELYVTQFMPFSLPIQGRRHASTLVEKVQQMLLVPILLFGLELTTVHRCTFSENDSTIPAECSLATPTKFRVANGIAISDDRRKVFVNDVLRYAITVFERNAETGMLKKTGSIKLTHAADNIEYTKSNKEELWMGTIPDMMVVAANEEKAFEERALVSGGLALVSKEANGDWGEQRVVYNHDGSMLSQVSFGMAHNGKIFLGSAYANGILVCEE